MRKKRTLRFRRRWRRYHLGNALGLYPSACLVIGILTQLGEIEELFGVNWMADRWRTSWRETARLAAGGAFAAVGLHFSALAGSTKMKSYIALLRKERHPIRRGAGDALIIAACFTGYLFAGYAFLGGFDTRSAPVPFFFLSLPVVGWLTAIGPVEYREFMRKEKLKSGNAPAGRAGNRVIR